MMLRLLMLAATVSLATALIYDIPHSGKKCVGEYFDNKVLVSGKYWHEGEPGPNDDSMNIELEVVGEDGKDLFTKKLTKKRGKFSFTSKNFGLYVICMKNTLSEGVTTTEPWTKRMGLDLKHGVDANDYTTIANTEHLSSLEVQLRQMEDRVTSLKNQIVGMKVREARMRATTDSTHTRVIWFAVLTIVTLVSLAVWQHFHVKKFLLAKKVI
eukprot:CAMPEP_0114561574 /NCGR_PEP_ID=MMETSP0114-20121206/12076_1 /TAXON_ID=31324 /ORGANISM="Goniomonas sp, Strain m" /LENGTH=211 /DNA_ID=CAMNT_0001747217 /DNA_START=10 /DNA_END=645 /DNA_ORIENTATION=+